jgi:hypothetical protein
MLAGGSVDTFATFRAQAMLLFAQLDAIAAARHAGAARRRISSGQARLADGRLTVVVCGEFKRGKSSLLNALLEEPGLFPVDSYYATSVITMASFARRERITVTQGDPASGLTQREISRAEIAAYATEAENPGNDQDVRLITIETPNQRLSSGLTIVDTPGIGGVYEAHGAATLGILPSADLLVFVTDATQPLTESELAFVGEASRMAQLADDGDAQVFAIAKTDALADQAEITASVTATTAKLAAATGRRPGDLAVSPVSARAKLSSVADGDQEYLRLSNFAAFEEALWAALGRRRVKALLAGALSDLAAVAEMLLGPIETELEALTRGGDPRLHEAAVREQDRSAWLASLDSDRARWHADLVRDLEEARRRLAKRGTRELDELWTRCQDVYLYTDRYLADTDQLVDRIAADATALTGVISEQVAREAARVLADIAKQNGLAVESPAIGRLPDPPVPVMDLSGELPSDQRHEGIARKFLRAGDATGPGSQAGQAIGVTLGATVGGVIGGLMTAGAGAPVGIAVGIYLGTGVGRTVGVALGGTFGALSGYKDAARTVRDDEVQARRARLWAELQLLRSAQENHLTTTLDTLMAGFSDAAAAELRTRIAQEQERSAEALTRLTRLRDAGEQAASQRRAELAAERAPLDRIRDQVGELALAAAGLGGVR